MIQRLLSRVKGRLALALTSDTAFVEQAYRDVLGREADADGLRFYAGVLREGASRAAVLLSLVRSDEFRASIQAATPLRCIHALRPSAYRTERDLRTGAPLSVFEAREPADFDWLESMIHERGYYERLGAWGLDVDVDKQVMAEIVAALQPRTALELGCASGATLRCLDALGVHAEGVDVSRMAFERAEPAIRSRIHRGDLLRLELEGPFDVVYGLDVFEHLNPNRLPDYLARVAGLVARGGHVVANIPAFGEDPVFGTVFPLYLSGWEQDGAEGRPFSTLQVDDEGFPLHGHLVWADSRYWVQRFAAAGLQREVAIERALHRRYDRYFDKRSPARKSLYVFSRAGDPARAEAIAAAIDASRSRVLADSDA